MFLNVEKKIERLGIGTFVGMWAAISQSLVPPLVLAPWTDEPVLALACFDPQAAVVCPVLWQLAHLDFRPMQFVLWSGPPFSMHL